MITKALMDSVKEGEGLRLKPYRCTAGKLSIGYGRNLDDCGITEEEAEYLLNNDLERAEKEAEKFPVYAKLNQSRKDVLIEMVFNMGYSRLSKFKKMFEALEKGDYSSAADQMLDSAWHTQVGKRAERLAYKMRIG
jgi:lysozyme